MILSEDYESIAKTVIKSLNIQKQKQGKDSKSSLSDSKLIVSEEKYRQRDVLERLNEIEIQKIGGWLRQNEAYNLEVGSAKAVKAEKEELLIDFGNKIVLSDEREFSSGSYDIKIYERTYKEGSLSYRLELTLNPPYISDIFYIDFQWEIAKRKNRVIIETVSLEDKNPNASESKSIIFTSSLVAWIYENSFPHYIEFILFEPSTRAEWSHKISSNTLSPLVLKENFIKRVYKNIREGPHRKWATANLIKIQSLTYENPNAIALNGDSFTSRSNLASEADIGVSNSFNSKMSRSKTQNLHVYVGDFSSKICSNFKDEEIDGKDKFNEIFRKYICKIPTTSQKSPNLSAPKRDLDLELILSSHSNSFLKLSLWLLENEVTH